VVIRTNIVRKCNEVQFRRYALPLVQRRLFLELYKMRRKDSLWTTRSLMLCFSRYARET
jgi:hypothetical protein